MGDVEDSVRGDSVFLLKQLAGFVNEDLLSRNSAGFVKILMLRNDVRLNFVTKRYMEDRIDRAEFLNQLLELIERESKLIFDEVFVNCTLHDAKLASRQEREQEWKGAAVGTSLTYGEIDFRSFGLILQRFTGTKGKTFYDLGSGTGRALVEARLLCDFDQCIGVELLSSLHNKAVDVVRAFDEPRFRNALSVSLPQKDVKVYEGSILEEDWSDGDFIFANSTCFSLDLIDSISKLGEKLRPGSIFVTFTKGLTSKAFELLEQVRLKMSWGPATVYIHKRRNHDGTPAADVFAFDKRRSIVSSSKKTGEQEQRQQSSSRSSSSSGDGSGSGSDSQQRLLQLSDLAPSSLVPGAHAGCEYELKAPSKKVSSLKFLLYCHRKMDVENYSDLPLVLYLHGASARGDTFDDHATMGLPAHVRGVTGIGSENFLLLSPLCPNGIEWKDATMCDAVNELTDAVCAAYSADRNRLYITGVSMGGLGCWMMCARNPGKWAAAMPMCGGGNPVYARLIKEVPFWFFHSEDDNVVGVEETTRLVDALRKENAPDVRYTKYTESKEHSSAQEWMVGHNVWTKAYAEPETWGWLFSHKLPIPHSH
jgi:predicted esterase/SAM-dependent methyltransferase